MRHTGPEQRPRCTSRWPLPPWLAAAGLALALLACTSPSAPAPTAAPAALTTAPTAPPAAGPTTAPATGATPSGITPLNPPVSLKLALSYQVPNNLPLMLALQRGDFARAGLNVEVQTITGSSAAILPQLSQGQIDIAQTVPAPALFNQAAQGFGVKLVAGGDVAKPGRIPSAILLVEKDEATQIQQLSDLKGKTIEGAAPGSPISLTVETAVREAGLTSGQDVTITYRVKDPSDFLALIRNHAADVVGTTSSTAVQTGDYAVPWKDSNEILPWYQATLIATSSQFLSANRPAVEKFVEVYIQAARDIDATNGVWTDDLVNLFAQKAGITPEAVKAQGQIPYFDPNATVSLDSLQQTQAFWVQQQQVPKAVDAQALVDPAIAQQAASSLGNG